MISGIITIAVVLLCMIVLGNSIYKRNEKSFKDLKDTLDGLQKEVMDSMNLEELSALFKKLDTIANKTRGYDYLYSQTTYIFGLITGKYDAILKRKISDKRTTL